MKTRLNPRTQKNLLLFGLVAVAGPSLVYAGYTSSGTWKTKSALMALGAGVSLVGYSYLAPDVRALLTQKE